MYNTNLRFSSNLALFTWVNACDKPLDEKIACQCRPATLILLHLIMGKSLWHVEIVVRPINLRFLHYYYGCFAWRRTYFAFSHKTYHNCIGAITPSGGHTRERWLSPHPACSTFVPLLHIASCVSWAYMQLVSQVNQNHGRLQVEVYLTSTISHRTMSFQFKAMISYDSKPTIGLLPEFRV